MKAKQELIHWRGKKQLNKSKEFCAGAVLPPLLFVYPLYMPLIKLIRKNEIKVFDIAKSVRCSYFKSDFFIFFLKPQTLFGSSVLTLHRALYVLAISQGSVSSLVKRAERKERNPFALNT